METPNVSSPYKVCWPQRDQIVSSSCYDYYKKSAFTDVTLSAEGIFIPCHQIILASCSTYFDVSLIHFPSLAIVTSYLLFTELVPTSALCWSPSHCLQRHQDKRSHLHSRLCLQWRSKYPGKSTQQLRKCCSRTSSQRIYARFICNHLPNTSRNTRKYSNNFK